MPDDQQPNLSLHPLLVQEQEREMARTRGAVVLGELKKRERGILHKSLETLRPAVDELCRAEFLAKWGREFSEKDREDILAEVRRHRRHFQLEREAEQILLDLKNAVQRALALKKATEDYVSHGGSWALHILREYAIPRLNPNLATLRPLNKKRPFVAPLQSDLNHLALAYIGDGGNPAMIDVTGHFEIPGPTPHASRDLAVVGFLTGVLWEDAARWEGACKRPTPERARTRVASRGRSPRDPNPSVGVSVARVIEGEANSIFQVQKAIKERVGTTENRKESQR